MSIRAGKEKEGLTHTLFFILALIVLVFDQGTKLIAARCLTGGHSIPIIKGFLNLTLVHNTGSAFGFFKNQQTFLILITFISIGLLIVFCFWCTKKEMLSKIALGLILGGALGNLADRVIRGYVVDFIECYYKSFSWPAFNVADSSITVGAILVGFYLLFGKGESTA